MDNCGIRYDSGQYQRQRRVARREIEQSRGDAVMTVWPSWFDSPADPRARHSLRDILVIAFCTLLCRRGVKWPEKAAR